VPVEAGKSTINFVMYGNNVDPEPHTLEVNVNKGETKIFPFYSLGAYEPKTLNRAKAMKN
jgi:hypothetical protein